MAKVGKLCRTSNKGKKKLPLLPEERVTPKNNAINTEIT
jgi:hypothetical protein